MPEEAGGHLLRRNAPTNRHRVRIGGQPQVAFLDEPTTGLDPGNRQAIWGIWWPASEAGHCHVVDTQYLEEADALSDRIILIDHGIIIAEGTRKMNSSTAPAYLLVVPAI